MQGYGDGTFTTPPVIESADTGPFFHNNSAETLDRTTAEPVREFFVPCYLIEHGNELNIAFGECCEHRFDGTVRLNRSSMAHQRP